IARQVMPTWPCGLCPLGNPTFSRSSSFPNFLTMVSCRTSAPKVRPELRLLNHEGRPALEVLKRLFASDFLPHGTCYLWNPKIVWLHVISDSVITLSYYCIPVALIYLVRKRRDLPFNWMFSMFGLFILGCGTTHLMEV